MKRWGAWASYVLLIFALVYNADPEVVAELGFRPRSKQRRIPKESIGPTYVYDLGAEQKTATSVFRVNHRRSGSDLDLKISHRLRESWNFNPLNVGIHGASKSSPAVDSSGIYVGTDAGAFFALDFDGRVRWQLRIPDAVRGIHGTAVLSEDTVYFGAYNGVFYALDKRSGSIRWTKKLGDAIGASPVLFGEAIYISVETGHPDGFMVKLVARTGELLWTSGWLGEQSHSSPTLMPEKNLVMAGSNNGEFWAFDMETGIRKSSWRLLDAMKSTAAATADAVFFTSWEKRLLALNVAADFHLRWALQLEAPSQSSPTIVPSLGLVVVADQAAQVAGVEMSTGKVLWQRQFKTGRFIASSLVTSSPAGDVVVWTACDEKKLCGLSAKTGKTLTTISLRANLSGVPVGIANRLYVALDGVDGGLSAFVEDTK